MPHAAALSDVASGDDLRARRVVVHDAPVFVGLAQDHALGGNDRDALARIRGDTFRERVEGVGIATREVTAGEIGDEPRLAREPIPEDVLLVLPRKHRREDRDSDDDHGEGESARKDRATGDGPRYGDHAASEGQSAR